MAIVHSAIGVTLLGGGTLGDGDLAQALELAPVLVAADGGAGAALAEGLVPQAVIGDLDSIGAAATRLPGLLHRIAEQDSTDFDKALRNIDAPVVLAVGFTGGRLDHELAVFHVLQCRPERRCVVIGAESLVLLCPPEIEFDLPPGSVFSLFPLGEVAVFSEGLRWPTAGIDFAPDRRIGTSNEVTGPVRLRCSAPRMLAIVPRAALGAVLRALALTPAGWPPRAG